MCWRCIETIKKIQQVFWIILKSTVLQYFKNNELEIYE